jgi:hypothetical protein
VAIRHVSGHRLIALVEVVSPANKDRAAHVEELVDKVVDALRHGVHVLLIDLFAPGRHDRHGIHGAVWDRFDDEPYKPPRGEPLTLVSYVGDKQPEAYVEHVAVGGELPTMPLFLDPERYVALPVEPTYVAAFRGTPEYWRNELERPSGNS